MRPLLAQRRQSLVAEWPEGIPPITGDGQRLTQVFVNLLANASKYAPEGTAIHIGGEMRGDRLIAWVEDEGPGLGDGDADTVFQRFRRSGDVEPEAPGLGLGLWIVRSIIERHGGEVGMERTPAGRTRFFVALPVGGERVKLLLVDDDADLRAVTSFALQQAGFLVVGAGSVPAAVAAFDAEHPDLVLLDINLPGGSGFDVCSAIRRASRVPIMMLTVRGEEEDLIRALELGADDYLTKPFSPRTLDRPRPRAAAPGRHRGERPHRGGRPRARGRHADAAPRRRRARCASRGSSSGCCSFCSPTPGQPVHTDRLLAHVWGHKGGGDRQVLKQLVHRLRLKLGEDPEAGGRIETVPAVGYRLVVGGAQAPIGSNRA